MCKRTAVAEDCRELGVRCAGGNVFRKCGVQGVFAFARGLAFTGLAATAVFADAGPGPVRAAAASGAAVELPEATGRRDGSGTPGSQPVVAASGPVAALLPGFPS